MTTRIDPTTLATEELAAMLRAWAQGSHPTEAAVELLIAHGTWLLRRDFRILLIDVVLDGWGPEGVITPVACVAWDFVESFLDNTPCSRTEAAILRLAASLAGNHVIGSLRDLTIGLDDINAALVLDALAHRYGWHERGTTRTVTGTFPAARPAPAGTVRHA